MGPRARFTAIISTVALAVAMLDGCLIDCRTMRAGSDSAAPHCHAAVESTGTAWQSTARCDHDHDQAVMESPAARFESPSRMVLVGALPAIAAASAPPPLSTALDGLISPSAVPFASGVNAPLRL